MSNLLDIPMLGGRRPLNDLVRLGIPFSLIRGGPKHRTNRRERKWEREKTHRGTRRKWKRWPRLKMPTSVTFLRTEALDFAYIDGHNWQWMDA